MSSNLAFFKASVLIARQPHVIIVQSTRQYALTDIQWVAQLINMGHKEQKPVTEIGGIQKCHPNLTKTMTPIAVTGGTTYWAWAQAIQTCPADEV